MPRFLVGAIIRTVLGEPTGTSSKLASMMVASIERYVVNLPSFISEEPASHSMVPLIGTTRSRP